MEPEFLIEERVQVDMKSVQVSKRRDRDGVRRILGETSGRQKLSGNIKQCNPSRDPDRASIASQPLAHVVQFVCMENDFIKQKKKRKGHSHLLGIESQYV